MILKSARIQNFRSVDDSGHFTLGKSTCLVGKNEAGKTAILQALEKIKPANGSSEYDKTRDYPRRYLNDYDSRHSGEDAVVTTTQWELEPTDIAAVELFFGKGCLPEKNIEVVKQYGTTGSSWTTHFDESVALEYLIRVSNFDAAEKASIGTPTTAAALITALEGRAEPTEKQAKLLAKLKTYRDSRPALKVVDILSNKMPKFLYFSHYDRMNGKISVDQLEEHLRLEEISEGDQVFLDFLDFAGTSLDELKSINQSEDLIAKVEAASNSITDQIFEYWTQNSSLAVEFSHREGREGDDAPFDSGTIMEARVRNNIHRMTVPFSERSAGFVWFFSFLIKFAKVAKDNPKLIILLDEPGLTLHAKAQYDLLRYFADKLEPKHQLIFSTHSPFMVPSDKLENVRTVEDVVEQIAPMRYNSKGTKVSSDVLSTDSDTLFPLQSALGYELSQSLFVGNNTLLVEGPSDLLYLKAASSKLKQLGRTSLSEKWTVCPTGGIDKVPAFASLFGGNKLNIAVLTDFANGQKGKVQRLKESQILNHKQVFSIADFVDGEEGDIEDLLSPDLLVKILNSAYGLSGETLLTSQKLLDADESTTRLIVKAEQYFRMLPATVAQLDHFTPAEWLIQNPAILEGEEETLSRFENVFQTFNGLLTS